MGSAYWVPYKMEGAERGCIVIGPFDSYSRASRACAAMRRVAKPAEYVGDVVYARSEAEALHMAEAAWRTLVRQPPGEAGDGCLVHVSSRFGGHARCSVDSLNSH